MEFKVGDKVYIRDLGLAFVDEKDTLFIVSNIRRKANGKQQIQLIKNGQVDIFMSNNMSWWAAERFIYAEEKKAKVPFADASGIEMKVGDFIGAGGLGVNDRGLASYIVTNRRVGIEGDEVMLSQARIAYAHPELDRLAADQEIEGHKKIYHSDKLEDLGWYSPDAFRVMKKEDGIKGAYFYGAGHIWLAYANVDRRRNITRFQVVGHQDGPNHKGPYELGEMKEINWQEAGLTIFQQELWVNVAFNIKAGSYGKPEVNVFNPEEAVDIEKLNEELKKLVAEKMEKAKDPQTEGFRGGPADFTVINSLGNKLVHKCDFGVACHYDLKKAGYANLSGRSKPFALLAYVNRIEHNLRGKAREAAQATADWIIKKSPWKDAFIKTSYKKALEEGLFVNIERTGNEIGSALIALRQLTEFPNQSATLAELRELEIPIEAAWILTFGVSHNNGVFTRGGLANRGHVMMHDSTSLKMLASFFKNGLPKEVNEKRAYRNWQGYDAIYGVIDPACNNYGNDRVPADALKNFFVANLEVEMEGHGFARKAKVSVESIKKTSDLIMKAIKEAA